MKKERFSAIDPQTEAKTDLDGRPGEFVISEGGDEFRVPCFLHKRGPFWYVFERTTGLGISMRGRKTISEALDEAVEVCIKFGGIGSTERAINGAIRLRGIINA